MKILQGQGVSKGVEHGPIYFCRRSQTLIQPDKADDPRFQGERLDRAMEQTAQQLGQMAELARAQAGDSAAQLFETHAMFLEDEDYTGAMEELLAEGYCAEYAVDQAGEQFSAMLAAMDDPYMQARAGDVKDVTGRILNNLMGVVEGGIDSQVPVILAAADLAPSETIQLDKSKILAIATQGGSGNSHTAILARTMGIPAVCGLGASFNESYHGKQAYRGGDRPGDLRPGPGDAPEPEGPPGAAGPAPGADAQHGGQRGCDSGWPEDQALLQHRLSGGRGCGAGQ